MESPLVIGYYNEQKEVWPDNGKHILAQYDEESIIVYQAFNPKIADAAVANQRFTTDSGYSFERMSWIKTNFLWMMFRSGWASKQNQERILALRVTRDGFEDILYNATFNNDDKHSLPSIVRLQWDPDHYPNGSKHPGRKAIQLGLKGDILKKFSDEYLMNVYDITDFVLGQRTNLDNVANLMCPKEDVYAIEDEELRKIIELDDN